MHRLLQAKGIIFDFDGTLADTKLDFEAMRAELGFSHGTPILERLTELEPTARKRAEAIIDRHEIAGAAQATVFPGVLRFLELMKKRGLRSAILTRNSRRATEAALKILNLPPFEMVLTREDAAPKPNPDGLLQICQAWDFAPAEALFIGDYLFDLEAGKRAGVPTYLFSPQPRDFPAEPDFEFDSFDRLAALLSEGQSEGQR